MWNVTAEEVEFPTWRSNPRAAKPARIGATLSTSPRVWRRETCVVLGPASKSPRRRCISRAEALRDVFIMESAWSFPASGNERFLQGCRGESPDAWSGYGAGSRKEQYIHLLNARRIRRMSDQVKLTLARRRSRARSRLTTWRRSRSSAARSSAARTARQLQRGVLQ